MPRKPNPNLQEFVGRATRWVHCGDASAANLREIGKRFNIHDHDLHEVLPALQHSKCIVRPGYLFLVLIFPLFDREKGITRETELDVFMTRHALVTVNHGNELHEIPELLDTMSNAARRELVLSQMPAEVIINLIDGIYKSLYPLLVQHTRDIDAVEAVLFNEYERTSTIKKILMLKTSNGRARKALQNHKNTLLTFRASLPLFESADQKHEHLGNLVNRTVDLWNTLESQRESIDYIHTTNETLLSYRINEIMKTLTIFSVIVFPLTLVAAVFGMNTTYGMPFVNNPNGFWYILLMMFGGALVMLGIFKSKKWL